MSKTPSPAATGAPPPVQPISSEIIGVTEKGDVVVVDAQSGEVKARLAHYPPAPDPDNTGEVSHLTSVEAAPDHGVLVVSCCEPVSGTIFVLDKAGEQIGTYPGFGVDVLESTGRVAIAESGGLVLLSSIAGGDRSTILTGGVLEPRPESPAWSLDGSLLTFAARGTVYTVPADAPDLGAATQVLPSDEQRSWYSPVFTRDGIAAIGYEGLWNGIGSMPGRQSSVVLVDSSGEVATLVESSNAITSLSATTDGAHLLWVDGGSLVWTDGENTQALPGDFVTATWGPGSR